VPDSLSNSGNPDASDEVPPYTAFTAENFATDVQYTVQSSTFSSEEPKHGAGDFLRTIGGSDDGSRQARQGGAKIPTKFQFRTVVQNDLEFSFVKRAQLSDPINVDQPRSTASPSRSQRIEATISLVILYRPS
jgi:hypothetical protein